MKRTPLRRKTGLRAKRGPRSKRAAKSVRERFDSMQDEEAEAREFSAAVIDRAMSAGGLCERCCKRRPLQAHHIVPRSRCKGWKYRHHPVINGSALCADCHLRVHAHAVPDWNGWLSDLATGEARAARLMGGAA